MKDKITLFEIYYWQRHRIIIYFSNFDYSDGIDILAQEMSKQYGDIVVDTLEGPYCRVITMQNDKYKYILCDDFDYGNEVYALKKKYHEDLKNKLQTIIDELNKRINNET